jgi:hypothetical protein
MGVRNLGGLADNRDFFDVRQEIAAHRALHALPGE